ncbi:MAG TPA: O-antigen ligase family protein [Pseudonocardiaceae bacterium]|nr:O-antigen ligase family protein [Pseudonocardiaceae bacterium]
MTSVRPRPVETLPAVRRNHAVPSLIVLIVALLCFRQDNIVPSTGLGLSPAYLLALVAGIGWLLGKGLRLTGSGALPVRLAIGGVLATQVVGYLVLLEHQGSGASLLVPAILALLALFVLDTVHSAEDLERLVRWLVIAGAIGAGCAVLGVAGHVDIAAITPPGLKATPELVQPIPRDGITRAQGTAAHPLELAAVMTVLFPLAVHCFFAARARGSRWWPWLIPLALIGAAGALSISRSFFVGLGVEFVILTLYWPLRRTAIVLGCAALGVIVLLFTKGGVVGFFVKLFTQGSGDDSLLHRTLARQAAYALINAHPLLGMGLGSYDTTRYPILDNQYLGLLVELGIVGLAGFLCYLGTAAWAAFARGGTHRELGAALGASIVAYAVINLILDTAGFLQISALAAILVGLTGALHRIRHT